MTGEAPEANPPIQWSETENVKWKTKLRGLGHSSPVLTSEHVFLTYAVAVGTPFEPIEDTAPGAHDNKRVDSEYEFVGACLSRRDGSLLWEKALHRAIPHEGAHISASLASASPVTDGKKVWFHFGSFGLYCLSNSGELIWEKVIGKMNSKHGHGEGASPVLHGDTIAINWDHEGQSFVMAMNKHTGETIWKQQREEVTSWASPIVVEHDNRAQLIVPGTQRIRGYDLSNGQTIWQCGGMSHNIVASPVYSEGMVFVGSSYEKRQMLGIKLAGANGDITSTDNVVWSRTARTPYVPSPLLVGGHLYFLRHYQGILSRLHAETGEEKTGPFRVGRMNEIYASPVSAAGRIYITDRRGMTAVMSTDDQPEPIGFNRLNDRFSASAAISGNQIVLRGEKFIYCLQDMQAANQPSDSTGNDKSTDSKNKLNEYPQP